MRSRVYTAVGRQSVGLSVCPSIRPPHAAAARLLLWAGPARSKDIDRSLHDRRCATTAPRHGAQQQTPAVPRRRYIIYRERRGCCRLAARTIASNHSPHDTHEILTFYFADFSTNRRGIIDSANFCRPNSDAHGQLFRTKHTRSVGVGCCNIAGSVRPIHLDL